MKEISGQHYKQGQFLSQNDSQVPSIGVGKNSFEEVTAATIKQMRSVNCYCKLPQQEKNKKLFQQYIEKARNKATTRIAKQQTDK